MNNVEQQVEVAALKPQSSIRIKDHSEKKNTWVENDNLTVYVLIMIGLFGLYYIPKTPFADSQHSSVPSFGNQPTSNNTILVAGEETLLNESVEVQHPKTVSTLILGSKQAGQTIQIAIDQPVPGWTYRLTIDEAAPLTIHAPFTNFTFPEAGTYNLKLTGQHPKAFELLEIKSIEILPSDFPFTASSQQKLTPF